jgi:predicted nucleic acid-binding protein
VKLLIDTNIVLEVLLGQQRAGEAQALLAKTAKHDLFLSDYSLHSIGLLLFRRHQHRVFQQFVEDMIVHAGVLVATLPVDDAALLVDAALSFKLDFDDAYQYALSERYGLEIVSFDADFDRTERRRKTPARLLES